MANPVNVICIAGAWTKVASGVVTGTLRNKKTTVSYSQTYVVADDPAPTTMEFANRCFVGDPAESISSASNIDVYIFAHGSVNGLVEADL